MTAELPPAVLVWADALRQAHYPPERNRLRAHVTLFHGLPPSGADEVHRLLGECAASPAPDARFDGVMDLGKGTAFAIASPAMVALHERLAERLHGLIQQKDARPLRLHVTVQNKVPPDEARALQRRLSGLVPPPPFRFAGFGTYRWDGKVWAFERLFPFRG